MLTGVCPVQLFANSFSCQLNVLIFIASAQPLQAAWSLRGELNSYCSPALSCMVSNDIPISMSYDDRYCTYLA